MYTGSIRTKRHPYCYNIDMQKIATKVFIYASILFGILGLINIFVQPDENTLLFKLFVSTIFIILPSFALSVAGKYLSSKS